MVTPFKCNSRRKEYPAYSNTLGVLQRHQRVVVISICNSNTLRCKFLPTLGTLGAELSVSQKIGYPEYLDLSCNSNPYMAVRNSTVCRVLNYMVVSIIFRVSFFLRHSLSASSILVSK